MLLPCWGTDVFYPCYLVTPLRVAEGSGAVMAAWPAQRSPSLASLYQKIYRDEAETGNLWSALLAGESLSGQHNE